MTDTIAAISTAFGEAAVAMIRVSGPRAIEVVGKLWSGKRKIDELGLRRVAYGELIADGKKLDNVLVSVFRGPHSYTGEDVVEISCHGGVLLSRKILEAILRSGARAAEPGEFTRRAYMNGKMDLTQAEAVMDLIRAQTELALRAAGEQLEGRLGKEIRVLRESVLETLAHVEAYIDFPEEDIDPDTGAQLRARIQDAIAVIGGLLSTAETGRILRHGMRTVICGEPNVGKSSLLNLLLGFERAIVSQHPGTTRDILEETVNLCGIPLRLVDTAGLRETEDELEQEGMERTRQALEHADLVLEVFDGSVAPPGEVSRVSSSRTTIQVLNKCDIGEDKGWRGRSGVRMSCKTRQGLTDLEEAIVASATGGALVAEWSIAINARHQACLESANGLLEAALRAFDEAMSPEFIAEELRGAMDAIGDIVGRADGDELLGVIFGRFCIGK